MDYLLKASTTMDDLGFFNESVKHGFSFNQSICLDSVTCQIDHTKVCVGDPLYCNLTRDEYTELLNDYIAPTPTEWILIFSHSIVFLMGLVSIRKYVYIPIYIFLIKTSRNSLAHIFYCFSQFQLEAGNEIFES